MSEIIKELRAAWSEYLLDFVEKLPAFGGGSIARLQEIRKRSRRDAAAELSKFQIPAGVEVVPKTITLLLEYPAEEFASLGRSLEAAFPNSWPDSIVNRLEEFGLSSSDVWAGSWANIGQISRTSGFSPHRIIKDLPTEVSRIEVQVHRVLPSLQVLSFRVHLHDSVGERLHELLATEYLGKLVFRYWFPFGKRWWVYYRRAALEAKQQAIIGYLNSIESSTQIVLKRYFKPPQMLRRERLASLREIHIATSDVVVAEETAETTRANLDWLFTLGLKSSYRGFTDERYTFLFEGEGKVGSRISTLLVRRLKNTPDSDGRSEFRDASVCSALAPMLAIRHLLLWSSDELGRHRMLLYKRVLGGRSLRSLKSDLELTSRTGVQKFIVQRLIAERSLSTAHLSYWASTLKSLAQANDKNNTLFESFESTFEHLEGVLLSHYKLLETLSHDYIEGRNLQASYSLSRQVWALAILALAVSVFSSLGSADKSWVVFLGSIRKALALLAHRFPS